MKLLLDTNISYRVLKKIRHLYPDALHVSRIGLPHPSDDEPIWKWAKANDCALIVSNDADFKTLLQQYGPPPKVIYLRTGNVGSAPIVKLLTQEYEAIQAFLADEENDLMEVIEIR